MAFAPPTVGWPDHFRGNVRLGEAGWIAEALGDNVGLAYLNVALIAETEISGDRAGSPLQNTAEEFLVGLRQLADASMDG